MEHDIAPTIAPGLSEEPAGRPIPEHRDSLLVTSETAFLLGLSPRTLEALRVRGGGPPFVKVTPAQAAQIAPRTVQSPPKGFASASSR